MSTDSPDALDLRALRQLANSATPGPWETRIDRYDPVVVSAGSNWPRGTDEAYATAYRLADAAFIAALNPVVALALLDALEQARNIAAGLEQQNAEALRLVNDTLDRAPGMGEWVFMDYLRDIARILSAFPDDETEQQ